MPFAALLLLCPLLRAAPLPAVRAELALALSSRVDSNGSRPEAVSAARAALREMFSQADPGIMRRLLAANARFDLVPEGVRMTDLPRYRSLRGQKTEDGRSWDELRGVGYVAEGDAVGAAAGEEDVLDPGVRRAGRRGKIFAHEAAHLVHLAGFSPEQDAELRALYAAATDRRWIGTALGDYASSSAEEFFAVGVSYHFGYAPKRGYVRAFNAGLSRFITRVLGPTRPLRFE